MLREDFHFEDAATDVSVHAIGGWTGRPAEPDYFGRGLKACTGRGAALDLVQAHKWFNIAALRGNAEARRYRTELALEMTRSEIAEAQRQARAWLARHNH